MAVRINLTKTSTRDKLKKHFKHRSSAGQKKLVYIYTASAVFRLVHETT